MPDALCLRNEKAECMWNPDSTPEALAPAWHTHRRQNLEDAARSDDTLRKLVDDNQAAFAAVGLGSLPDVDGAMGWVRDESYAQLQSQT